MSLNHSELEKTIQTTKIEALGSDLKHLGWLKAIHSTHNEVQIELKQRFPLSNQTFKQVEDQLLSALLPLGVESVKLNSKVKVPYHQVQPSLKPKAQIKNIIAVASGKGGVGKSTVAANLALGLKEQGAKVGILDADIYGPSQAMMLGVCQKPAVTQEKKFIPVEHLGLHIMSMAFLVETDTPMIWRGPMVSGALQQFLNDTHWPELDYLVIDLPPGTGDIQLTMAQKLPISGAVIVTTPQDVALIDAKKAINMFHKVNIDVLGLVENMAMHTCSHCGHTESIFGEAGGQKLAEASAIAMLGRLPLLKDIRVQADAGVPMILAAPNHPASQAFREVSLKTMAALSLRPQDFTAAIPNIVLQS